MKSKLALGLLMTLSSHLAFAGFDAHEWGTFTSLVGSNGVTQNGMTHEDERLPSFVHGFGQTQTYFETRDLLRAGIQPIVADGTPIPPSPYQGPPSYHPPYNPPHHPPYEKGDVPVTFLQKNTVTQKMETPVIYFYAKNPQHVQVHVQFPEGILTETYPGPERTSPQGETAELGHGDTIFTVDVIPGLKADLPAVDPSNIYSHARNVQSDMVTNGTETEKFIFYRGLGRFQPRFSIQSVQGSLRLQGSAANLPRATFLVHVDENGAGQLLDVGTLRADVPNVISADRIRALMSHSQATPGILSQKAGRQLMIRNLILAGLNPDEATAMLDTWEQGYLKVPGLRLLYILPRAEVDQVLPLSMTPKADDLRRVFVGRIEILLDTQEKALLAEVLAKGDNFEIGELGRFAEPILRRLQQVEADTVNHSVTNSQLLARLIERAQVGLTSSGVAN